VTLYNERRPHQSLEQNSPFGYIPQTKGQILKIEILGGLIYDYFRSTEVPM